MEPEKDAFTWKVGKGFIEEALKKEVGKTEGEDKHISGRKNSLDKNKKAWIMYHIKDKSGNLVWM